MFTPTNEPSLAARFVINVAEAMGLVCANGAVFPDSPVACDLTPVPTRLVQKSWSLPFGDRLAKIGAEAMGCYLVGRWLAAAEKERLALASLRGTDHGICTNNVRMQTKRLLLGMVGRKRPVSALLTDEVVHEHTALASLRA